MNKDKGHEITDKMLAGTISDVDKVYRQAAEEVKKKLDDYLRRFQAKGKIKLELLKKGKITQEEYNRWRTGQIMMGKRWEEMKNTLSEDLHNANGIARHIVDDKAPDVYAVNHDYATFLIEKESGINTSYTLYSHDTVEKLIREQPDLLPPPGPRMLKSIADGKDIAWQRGQIQSVTIQAILQGESIPNMARRIARTMGSNNKAATVRYARTAITGAENAGRVDAFKRAEDMGIEVEQEWLATLDGRTRYEHRQLDGQHVKVGEPFEVDGYEIRFPGDPTAPGHLVWNCRCTLVPRVKGVDQSNAPRNSKLGDMTYEEWREEHTKPVEQPYAVEIPTVQVQIGKATTVQQVNDIINSQGWWSSSEPQADLTGCDLESAKAIASAYQRVYERYPQLIGQIDAPDAHPVGMQHNTYAWCRTRRGGKVQVNPARFNDWNAISRSYERDVIAHFHPQGTTAESIVTHEIGHSVDGLLANRGILGGYNASGEFNTASSRMRSPIMKSCGYSVSDIPSQVSRYAALNPREWFAECFAEYMTSSNPRPVAQAFGKRLEELLSKM